jgi:nitrate reductase gamma subunit
MENAIDLARGPLFALTFGIMVLGLARLVLLQVHDLVAGKGRRLQNAPWRKILGETFTWALPFKHFIKGTLLFSAASFTMHIGLIIVPLFLADHVALWEAQLGIGLPAIGRGAADVLTLVTLACLFVLLGCRVFSWRHRAVSGPGDYWLLVAIIVPFATGFLATHPGLNPFRWDAVMLVHLLGAEVLFVLVPFTKLAHVVLFAFDRISELHWQLRPGAGDRVARALFGSEAKV